MRAGLNHGHDLFRSTRQNHHARQMLFKGIGVALVDPQLMLAANESVVADEGAQIVNQPRRQALRQGFAHGRHVSVVSPK